MDKFPYKTGDKLRKVVGKPEEYKGWTIWSYKIWCQQTGSNKGEWCELTCAVKAGQVLHGCVYQQIDGEA